MPRMTWTGVGCVTPLLLVLTVNLAVLGALTVGEGVGARLTFAAVFLAGAALHRAFAWAVNSKATPEGRVWTDRHTYGGVPVEKFTPVWVLVGLAALATVVAALTTTLVGWLAFGALVVGALLAWTSRREGKVLAGLRDRRELARRRGWHYQDRAPGLPARWKDVIGWRHATITPLGVLAGEVDGLPFTVFDSLVGPDGVEGQAPRTTWVVHLPVALPRVDVGPGRDEVLRAFGVAGSVDRFFEEGALLTEPDASATGAGPSVHCPDAPELARDLLTPAVRAAADAAGLTSWRIVGPDLVVSSGEHRQPLPLDEVVARVEALAALARAVVDAVGDRHGTAPAVEPPLAAERAAAARGDRREAA